ncbi:MAG: hypothetical protein KGL93_12070, partial [Gemmatimonadota bacterium]|nr:hypothetical protein [Gemmatimonadota bacterium]
APASRTPEESDDLARASFDVLDRFGAAIEAALAEADAFERPAPPRPAPVTATPAPDGAALDAEIAQHLRDEGIIVRGADVARVVALMSGGSVTWE